MLTRRSQGTGDRDDNCSLPRAAGDVGGVELASFANIEAWYEACVKLVPNYEKANGEGAAAFGAFYKSKC